MPRTCISAYAQRQSPLKHLRLEIQGIEPGATIQRIPLIARLELSNRGTPTPHRHMSAGENKRDLRSCNGRLTQADCEQPAHPRKNDD